MNRNRDDRAVGTGKQSKRASIVTAATDLFLSNGFDRTSMDEVATQAGVSKTTVYAHFADKLELFHSVVRDAAATSAPELSAVNANPDLDTEDALASVIFSSLRAITTQAQLSVLRVVVAASPRWPEMLRVARDAGPANLVPVVTSIIERDAERENYTIEDPSAYALLLLRMALPSYQIEGLLFPDALPSGAALETYARSVASIFLRGLRPRADSGGSPAAPPPSSADSMLATRI